MSNNEESVTKNAAFGGSTALVHSDPSSATSTTRQNTIIEAEKEDKDTRRFPTDELSQKIYVSFTHLSGATTAKHIQGRFRTK